MRDSPSHKLCSIIVVLHPLFRNMTNLADSIATRINSLIHVSFAYQILIWRGRSMVQE